MNTHAGTTALRRRDEILSLIREETISCYLGDRSRLFDWGRGCGLCPACGLRAAGWQAWQAARGAAA